MNPKPSKRRGPKTELQGEPVRNVQVTMDEKTQRLLKVLGNGNVSRGVREAVRFTYDAYQNDRFVPPK